MAGGNVYAVGAVNLVGGDKIDVSSTRIGKRGTVQRFNADGDSAVKLIWVEDRYWEGEFDGSDLEGGMNAPEVGAHGSASIAWRKRAAGMGYEKTITALIENVVIAGVDMSASHGGPSTIKIPFEAFSSDGSTSPITFS